MSNNNELCPFIIVAKSSPGASLDELITKIADKYGFGTQHYNLRLALREAYEAGRESTYEVAKEARG